MSEPTDRRQFLGQTLGAVTATAGAAALTEAAPVPQAQEQDKLPIVDTHLHLWDLDRFRLPWVQKGSPLARSFVMKDWLTATAGLNVVRAVYMEVDVDPKQQVAEAEYVIDICRQGKTPMAAAVISGRPADPAFEAYLNRFKGSPYIKGLRQVLHTPATPAGFCLGEAFVKGIRLLGDRGLTFDLCMRPGELRDGLKLTEACPSTRFILDHCGNGPVFAKDRTQWQKDMTALAQRKNVVCKVSGIVAQCQPGKWTANDLAPVVNHTLNVFGPERVLFAGDWPVCTLGATYRQWVDALKEIVRQRPLAQQRRLFHDNAVAFYGLK
jgi:predicted TIM-barrel fold metal-dependent hydrolase